MNTLLTAAAVHGPAVLAVDPAKVKPGWLALVIVLLMGLATYLLWRSMNRQLKKVNFDDGGSQRRAAKRSGRFVQPEQSEQSEQSEQPEQPEQPAGDGAWHDRAGSTGSESGEGPLPDDHGGASRP